MNRKEKLEIMKKLGIPEELRHKVLTPSAMTKFEVQTCQLIWIDGIEFNIDMETVPVSVLIERGTQGIRRKFRDRINELNSEERKLMLQHITKKVVSWEITNKTVWSKCITALMIEQVAGIECALKVYKNDSIIAQFLTN